MTNITYINLSDLIIPEFEAHKETPEENILELTESIKTHGILQPLLVRPNGSNFEIVAGCIRHRCAKLAGLKTAPCIILSLDDKTAEIVKLHENTKRVPLCHVDQGNTFVMLREKFSMTLYEIALSFGKSPAYVSQHISLISQDNDIADSVRFNRISFSQARELMTVEDKSYRKYLHITCVESGLSVELLRQWIKDHKRGLLLSPTSADSADPISSLSETPQYCRPCQACGKPVDIKDIRHVFYCPQCDIALKNAISEENSRLSSNNQQ